MKRITFVAAGLLSLATPALADDGISNLALPEPGTWEVRLRALGVLPDVSAKVAPIGGTVHISNQIVPEADISYFLDSHWALELIAGTTRHSLEHIPTHTDLGSVCCFRRR